MHMQGTSNCGGLISGNLVVTHKGSLDVHAHGTELTMHLAFKEPGMFSGKRGCKHKVRGPFQAGQYVWACLKSIAAAPDHTEALHINSLGSFFTTMQPASAEPFWQLSMAYHRRAQ